MKRFGITAALLLCLISATPTFSQVNATVDGTVSDATGALIPGAEITARNVNTGIVDMRITNEAGSYSFPSLQPGTYALSASLPGFQTATFNNVQLSQSQQVRLNFSLQVGAVSQAVEVVVDADTALATTSASVADVLPDVEVRSLPLATRNVMDLVRVTAAGAVDNYFGGTRMSQLNTTRDGLTTSDGRYLDWNGAYSATFTSPDLVEEVQIMVNSIDAAVGRGSGQVRIQTRSGANDFHGALFYANNNSALGAQTWFQNLVRAPKSYRNRNQYGGRIGGPIVRNKAFFFALIDGQRYLEKQDLVATVLTGPARQGVFRFLTANAPGTSGGAARRNGNAFSTTPSVDLNGNVLSSAGGTPLFMNSFNLFSDVRDPNRTRIDPVWMASQYLPRTPLPNDYTVGDGLNTAGHRWLRRNAGVDSSTGHEPNTNRDHLSMRFDYQVNTNNKLTYTMTREEDWGVTDQTGRPTVPGGYFGDVRRKPDFYTAAWTSTISPRLLNELRWGFKRDVWLGTSPVDLGILCGCDANGNPDESGLTESAKEARATFPKIGGFFLDVKPPNGANTLDLGLYSPFTTASPRGSFSPLMQVADTVSLTHRTHSFQGGFEGTFASTDQYNHGGGGAGNSRPTATLGVGNIPVPGVNSVNFPGLQANDITTAQDILGTLAGTVATLNHQFFVNSPTATKFEDYRTTIMRIRNFHQNDWAAFFKDNWKVTNNLTLSLGVRYDKYGVPYDSTGLGAITKGGQAGLFGISGTDFNSLWNPNARAGSPTIIELAGKHSPNPDKLIYKNDWNNVAPSVGFSWSLPWFTRSTVVRGGYGVNYTGAPTFLQYSGQIGSLPGQTFGVETNPATYVNLSTLEASGLLPLSTGGAQPFGAVPLTSRTQQLHGYTDDRVIPYVQNFNLSIQRELSRDLSLEISYVGSKGTKLWQPIELNELNIFENGILDAFNVTRAGGTAPLFNQILMGRNVPGAGVVNGTTLTGSEAMRRYTTTNIWIANGEAANLANWINSTNALTGQNGGLLRGAGLPENFIVVNPQFGQVRLHGNNDNSIYHSMQLQLRKRLSNGLTGQVSYTWAKNLGNSAGGLANNGDTTASTRDPRNRDLQSGLVAFHRTHVLKGYSTWQLPFGPGRAMLGDAPAWVSRIVEGWELSGISSWNSGAPLSFTTSRRTLGTRANLNTADLVGALPEDFGKVQVRDRYVEYLAGLSTQRAPVPNFGGSTQLAGRFADQVVVDASGKIVLQNPLPGKTGNLALNTFEGPGRLGLDMSLSKRVRINETASFTIRADAVNFLNKPIWGNPNTDINSASFGRITGHPDGAGCEGCSFAGARTITVNARIDF